MQNINLIPELFKKSGLTMTEVSKRAGISFATTCRYLKGEVNHPRENYVNLIINALNNEEEKEDNAEEETEKPLQVKRGDIYYVKNQIAKDGIWGSRPAVVVSSDKINQSLTTVEIVYMTSKPKPDIPTHATVQAKTQSTVLCEQINTVSKDRLTSYIGKVSDVEMAVIENALAVSLGLKSASANTLDYIVLKTERNLYEKFYKDLLSART